MLHRGDWGIPRPNPLLGRGTPDLVTLGRSLSHPPTLIAECISSWGSPPDLTAGWHLILAVSPCDEDYPPLSTVTVVVLRWQSFAERGPGSVLTISAFR